MSANYHNKRRASLATAEKRREARPEGESRPGRFTSANPRDQSFTKVTHRAPPARLKALAYWKLKAPADVCTWGRRREALLTALAAYEAGGLAVIVNDLGGWPGGWELAVGFETMAQARSWAQKQEAAGLKGEGEPESRSPSASV